MKKLIVIMLALSLFVSGFVFEGIVNAEEFPQEPLTFVVPFGPGGGADQLAQALKPEFEDRLGQPFRVSYRPGASAQIGFEVLNSMEADGHNLGFLTTPHLQLTILTQDPNYNIDSFMPLGTHHMDSVIFYERREDSKYENIYDVVEDARENPGEVTIAVGSLNSDMGIAILALQEAAGVDFAIIPTGGGADVMAGVLGGHYDVGVHRPTSALPSKDNLHGLGILTDERVEIWPETPTFKEALPSDIEVPVIGTWRGAFVRREVYEEYPERFELLRSTYEEIITSEEYKEEYEESYGWTIDYRGPEETMDMIHSDHKLMEQFIDLIEEE